MSDIYMRFPAGKTKALTLSYDDGVEQDKQLISIMQKNGLKGTFNLNSGLFAPEDRKYPPGYIHRVMSKKQCLETFQTEGIEVAVHSLTHPHLETLPDSVCTYEIIQDRINLEESFQGIVRGMAYPYGTTADNVVDVLKKCGIAYARTVAATRKFHIPTDWLRLNPTCRHADPRLMELAKEFVEMDVKREPALFYLWGHSYEFERDNNWDVIEAFAEYMGNREEIWYATNIEIYDYVHAYQKLVFSANGAIVYNPTDVTLYFETKGKLITVKSGETKEVASC